MTLLASPPRPLLAALLLLTAGAAHAAPPALIEWDTDPDALVLRYEERSDKLAQVDPMRVELFGDGRLLVHRPAPYANPGVHELRLSAWDMQQFLEKVALPKVVGFEPGRVKEEKRAEIEQRRAEAASRGQRPVLHYRSEKERIVLELHLTRYRQEGGSGAGPVDLTIEWRGLRQDRDEVPGNASLAQLSSAVETTRRMLDAAVQDGR